MPDIWSWLRKNYWAFPKGLFWSSVYVWIPIQVVNLYWVPLPFRVLYMNVSVMVRSLPCPRALPTPPPPSRPAHPPLPGLTECPADVDGVSSGQAEQRTGAQERLSRCRRFALGAGGAALPQRSAAGANAVFDALSFSS